MLGAQPSGDPIGEVTEHRADQFGRHVAPPEARLRADRSGAALRLHPTLVVVGGERADLSAERASEQRLQRAVGRRGQLADGADASLGEALTRDRPDAPDQPDRKRVEERALVGWMHDDEAVGLGNLRRDLGEVLGTRGADRDGQPDLGAHAVRGSARR